MKLISMTINLLLFASYFLLLIIWRNYYKNVNSTPENLRTLIFLMELLIFAVLSFKISLVDTPKSIHKIKFVKNLLPSIIIYSIFLYGNIYSTYVMLQVIQNIKSLEPDDPKLIILLEEIREKRDSQNYSKDIKKTIKDLEEVSQKAVKMQTEATHQIAINFGVILITSIFFLSALLIRYIL
jgi:hypothetical protein